MMTDRSDSTAPLDNHIEKNMLGKTVVVHQESVKADDVDDDLESLPDLKRDRTNDTDFSEG